VRASDWVARYGGEEFVVVLPETSVVNAGIAAEHLRSQVASIAFSGQAVSFAVSASFGTSGWRDVVPTGATLDSLMAKCDGGVYASKAAGRNRVTVEPMD
jgi:diguanylate cyclase (GGDEF)-like protein